MNKKTTLLIILAFVLVAIIGGASILYNRLSGDVSPDRLSVVQNPETTPNQTQNQKAEDNQSQEQMSTTEDKTVQTTENKQEKTTEMPQKTEPVQKSEAEKPQEQIKDPAPVPKPETTIVPEQKPEQTQPSEQNPEQKQESVSNQKPEEKPESGQEQTSAQSSMNDAPKVPTAPDFTIYTKDGRAVKLSNFFGKPIILNFWASWCGPCKMEMPDFEKKYLEIGNEINFLMVNSTDGSRETVDTASSFIKSQGYTFPVFYDTTSIASMTYEVYSLPTTYFISRDGQIIARASGVIDAETLQRGIDMIK